MDKMKVLQKICDCGLVAIVRTEEAEQSFKIASSCAEAGIAAVEVSLTVPGGMDVIKELAKKYNNGEVFIGAGTVLDPETARLAILAGAQYIIAPYLNVETVRLCNRYQIACMPGAMTIKEVAEAMEAGADMIKVFPSELFGPAIIKAIKGPLPQAKLMPTGGVRVENVGEWIKAGSAAVGVGTTLVAGAQKGDYKSVATIGRQFIEKIKEARK